MPEKFKPSTPFVYTKDYTDPKSHRHIIKSYGATTGITSFLTQLEVINLQHLCKWMYQNGIARVQFKIPSSRLHYFCGEKSMVGFNAFLQSTVSWDYSKKAIINYAQYGQKVYCLR